MANDKIQQEAALRNIDAAIPVAFKKLKAAREANPDKVKEAF